MVAFVILTVIPSSIVIWRISKVQKSWIIQWAFLFAIPRLHTYCVCSFYGAAVKPVSAWDQSQCFGIARQALCQRAGSSAESFILWLDHQSCLEDWETKLPERDTLTFWAACSLCRELQVSCFCALSPTLTALWWAFCESFLLLPGAPMKLTGSPSWTSVVPLLWSVLSSQSGMSRHWLVFPGIVPVWKIIHTE